ncbi:MULTISPECIES: indolepyruvate ferredoxin oxidoreductase family protein [unclassified Rhodococcus (in: high G+C Gram-positive bacteria)]|uniref:indolepyruvate ferredoxin oxidoreductase family protein n=1 Tax=unclassified Rhodococcus (in: high G+C Gram-positive bacteria) TaxID=192944 RepID=UPI0015C69199|nr:MULTISPECIES: indolepyruvate ferredoxin oxidoreductase family protein [unclassified Rhodococcus (in: high G+C Gram-positive bacteria)]
MPTDTMRQFSLDDRYLRQEGGIYLTGIQALVRTLRDRALLDSRRGLVSSSFVSGYEGSPLAGYDLEIMRRQKFLADSRVVHRPAVNEELAATSVAGSQLARQAGTLKVDSVTGYWYGKAPGLDRASDAIRHANLIGTDSKGGVVALVGDDPAAKSSTYPCSSESALADLYIPTLYAADSQDMLDLAVHSVFLSRFTGLWSALKVATAVADGASTADVHPLRLDPTFGELGASTHVPSAKLMGTNLAALEESQISTRLPRAVEYARLNDLNRVVVKGASDRIGIIASGKTYLDVRDALTILGLDDGALNKFGIRILKLGMIYPLDPRVVSEFADGLDEIIVVEEKRSFIETGVKEILYGRVNAPAITGKIDSSGLTLFPANGELDVDSVTTGLARRLGKQYEIEPVSKWRDRPRNRRIMLPIMNRTPYFCSGCPHNSSTKVNENTIVGGGIGCHAMVLVMDESQAGDVLGVTQMGGEGAQWIGMAPFLEEDHFVQNVGDGTFMHSGSLALRAAVASGVNVTYKILFNATVAMTGGQDPTGGMPLDRLVQLLKAEGVSKIVVTTEDRRRVKSFKLPKDVGVRDRDDLAEVQRELATVSGVSVLIHDQECAAEKRRKRKRGTIDTPAERVVINERICEGCGDCGAKSNCLSVRPIATEFGRKTEIHQSSCNLDFSCLDGDCPSFVTVVPGVAEQKAPVADLDAGHLPSPERKEKIDEFDMRIMGVGGTGVITVAQILATAAVLDGLDVRSLDQTGLAQKGGAVISDIKMSATAHERSNKVGAESCDLYLVCDSLVGTEPGNLKVASRLRTSAVVSTTEIPTGKMIVDTLVSFPEQSTIRSTIENACARTFYLDPGTLAIELFDDEQYSNMIAVGAAFQASTMPLSTEAVEQAITLNGASVAVNLQAFRRGRQAVADPDALRRDLDARTHSAASSIPMALSNFALEAIGSITQERTGPLVDLLEARVDDLVAFQNHDYATRYCTTIAQVRTLENAAVSGSEDLTRAVARYLYKLMAYKDEYEVARLALDPQFDAELAAGFGRGNKAAIRLHPPVLRALGMKNKLSLGRNFRPALRTLVALRRVRGTKLDVFGYAHVRRLERELVVEYTDTVLELARHLTPESLATAVAIAELPDMVRGYESIKTDNVARYRSARAELLTSLSTSVPALAALAAG